MINGFRNGTIQFGLLLDWDAESFNQARETLERIGIKIIGGGRWSTPKPTGAFIDYCLLICTGSLSAFNIIKESNRLVECNPIPDLPGLRIYAGAGG